jgi:hypothetical protein
MGDIYAYMARISLLLDICSINAVQTLICPLLRTVDSFMLRLFGQTFCQPRKNIK